MFSHALRYPTEVGYKSRTYNEPVAWLGKGFTSISLKNNSLEVFTFDMMPLWIEDTSQERRRIDINRGSGVPGINHELMPWLSPPKAK